MSGVMSPIAPTQLDSIAAHIQQMGSQSAGLQPLGARSDHVHPMSLPSSGAAPLIGIARLTLGTVTVASTAVTAQSAIGLTVQPGSTPLSLPFVSSITPGVGFTITSLSALDAAFVLWVIFQQG